MSDMYDWRMTKETTEAKFDRLRARYVAEKEKLDAFESRLRRKYGPGWNSSWLIRTEEKRIDQLRAAKDKAGKILFDFIQSISPRDWSYDVPANWVREDLAFADVVRPVSEPLSVVPPLSYGATKPRT